MFLKWMALLIAGALSSFAAPVLQERVIFHVMFTRELDQVNFFAPLAASNCVDVTYNSSIASTPATAPSTLTVPSNVNNVSSTIYSDFYFNCSDVTAQVDNETMLLLSRSSLPSAVYPFIVLSISSSSPPSMTTLPIPPSGSASLSVSTTWYFTGEARYPYPCRNSAIPSYPAYFQNGPPQLSCVTDLLCWMLLDGVPCNTSTASMWTVVAGGTIGSLDLPTAIDASGTWSSQAYFLRSDFCDSCGGGAGYVLNLVFTPNTDLIGSQRAALVMSALSNTTSLQQLCGQLDGCTEASWDTVPGTSSTNVVDGLRQAFSPDVSATYVKKKYNFLIGIVVSFVVVGGLLVFVWVYSGSGAELRN